MLERLTRGSFPISRPELSNPGCRPGKAGGSPTFTLDEIEVTPSQHPARGAQRLDPKVRIEEHDINRERSPAEEETGPAKQPMVRSAWYRECDGGVRPLGPKSTDRFADEPPSNASVRGPRHQVGDGADPPVADALYLIRGVAPRARALVSDHNTVGRRRSIKQPPGHPLRVASERDIPARVAFSGDTVEHVRRVDSIQLCVHDAARPTAPAVAPPVPACARDTEPRQAAPSYSSRKQRFGSQWTGQPTEGCHGLPPERSATRTPLLVRQAEHERHAGRTPCGMCTLDYRGEDTQATGCGGGHRVHSHHHRMISTAETDLPRDTGVLTHGPVALVDGKPHVRNSVGGVRQLPDPLRRGHGPGEHPFEQGGEVGLVAGLVRTTAPGRHLGHNPVILVSRSARPDRSAG